EARPTIPYQRAVLKFDGREETMLVESVLQGPVGTYGWIVPLPTKPSFVKAVNPQYTEQSFAMVKPPIQTHKPYGLEFVGFSALVFAAVTLSAGLRYRHKELGKRVLYFVGEVCLLILIWALFVPVFSQARVFAKSEDASAGASPANADVEKRGLEVS